MSRPPRSTGHSSRSSTPPGRTSMPSRLANLWDAAKARTLSEPERLLYRSNLLGSDLRITNFGGGNTSAKVMQRDPLSGVEVEVLWVKGSGGDLGSMKLDGFATLYLSKLEQLKQLYRGPEREDEMVGYLPHCTFNLNPRAASIDTPLHAYVPYKHVDHMHPDAVIAMAAAQAIMPVLRGKIMEKEPKVGHFDDSAEVLQFACSRDLEPLAALGTSCPDHFLRTKIRPLVLDLDREGDVKKLVASLDGKLEAYRNDYARYYQRCKRSDSPAMRDPNPVIYLVPGVGMLSFAQDKATARIAGEFYINAINVMRGASSVDRYVSLPEQEAFDIEYWLLEEAKLQRMPKPRSLAGRIAFITGGAGGIGRATALRLLAEGACVTLADVDAGSLQQAVSDLTRSHGKDVVHGVVMNVVDEAAVVAAFGDAVRRFGGLDIVVSNAGIASAAAVEETTLELWRKNMDVLATGYFLVARTGYRVLKEQGRGGSIVFVGSKNALAASAGASAYCTAKAAEIHLARCLALEGAPLGIRVNVVNPDAVIRGSRIWSSGSWREERAAANKIGTEDVEEFYRKRSLLQRSVFPEDVAEGIYFFASEVSGKSTGNILNVDAGNAVAFTR